MKFVLKMRNAGMPLVRAAMVVGRPLRTVQEWIVRSRRDGLVARSRGRRPERGTRAQRNEVVETLFWLGPRTGVPTLQRLHPHMSRGELGELKRRFVRWYKRKYRRTLHVLDWTRPGAVWAMDFCDPPKPLDGEFEHLLLVKDLGSEALLEVLPTCDMKALTVIDLLAFLFDFYGAPLVIKSDNGSGFISEDVRAFLKEQGVKLLLSPPHIPSYNGAAEAGVGTVKTHAFWHATLSGRPCQWTLDDVYAAKSRANATVLAHGHTPLEVFDTRQPVTQEERETLDAVYRSYEKEGRQRLDFEEEDELTLKQQAQVDRYALRKALTEIGYLTFRRRSVTPVLWKKKGARIP